MPAVVAHGPADYRFEELPVPKPSPGEVVIKVKRAGICANDIKCYTMEEIVTHRLPLADYQKGIEMVVSGLTSVKVTLEPESSPPSRGSPRRRG
jgi:NADPH:quinone reductase-like Zn-dependent oxidoreductase